MKKLALAVFAAVVRAGCANPMIQVKKDLGPKASEYMECAQDKLVFEDTAQVTVMPTRVKVKGCGKETLWQLEESRWKKQ